MIRIKVPVWVPGSDHLVSWGWGQAIGGRGVGGRGGGRGRLGRDGRPDIRQQALGFLPGANVLPEVTSKKEQCRQDQHRSHRDDENARFFRATPHNLARSPSLDFWLNSKFGKRRNTVCTRKGYAAAVASVSWLTAAQYFSFFKLKKWGKKTAAARRHNCAVLP